MEIILASNSSRRKNLLTMLNVPFSVRESGVDERVEEANYMQKGVEHTPYEWVRAIAAIKAEAVGNRVEGEKIIIAADTIVTYMGKILHRPFKSCLLYTSRVHLPMTEKHIFVQIYFQIMFISSKVNFLKRVLC